MKHRFMPPKPGRNMDLFADNEAVLALPSTASPEELDQQVKDLRRHHLEALGRPYKAPTKTQTKKLRRLLDLHGFESAKVILSGLAASEWHRDTGNAGDLRYALDEANAEQWLWEHQEAIRVTNDSDNASDALQEQITEAVGLAAMEVFNSATREPWGVQGHSWESGPGFYMVGGIKYRKFASGAIDGQVRGYAACKLVVAHLEKMIQGGQTEYETGALKLRQEMKLHQKRIKNLIEQERLSYREPEPLDLDWEDAQAYDQEENDRIIDEGIEPIL